MAVVVGDSTGTEFAAGLAAGLDGFKCAERDRIKCWDESDSDGARNLPARTPTHTQSALKREAVLRACIRSHIIVMEPRETALSRGWQW